MQCDMWSLTHWGRVMHICVSKLTVIGSDNGLLHGRRPAFVWTNVEILLTGPLGTNFSEILIEIPIFPFNKMYLKMSYGKWQAFCLGLNVLMAKVKPWVTYCGPVKQHLPLPIVQSFTKVLIITCQSSEYKQWILLDYTRRFNHCGDFDK